MKAIHLMIVAAALLSATACSERAKDAASAQESASASGQPDTAAQANARDATRAAQGVAAPGQTIDGPLANNPAATLPGRGSSASSASSLATATADVDSVRLALLDGLGEQGANLRVQVTPRGVVSLSGEVATVADRQRAHYLARALPGVAEVDLRGVRVRQP
jgi:osmotically-inducible protein OsmY